MNVAVSQLNPTVGDIQSNKEKIIEHINRATGKGADLIVFGEMALSGTPTYDIVNMTDFVDKCYSALSDIAEAAANIDVLVGMPTVSGDDTFNSVAYIREGKVVDFFSKAMPFSRDELPYYAGIDSPSFFDENESQTDELPEHIITVDGYKMLIMIGDDLQFINSLQCFDTPRTKPDFIMHLAARPYSHGALEEDIELLSSVAKENEVPLVSVNLVGGNTDIVYYGSSVIFNKQGQMIKRLKNFEEDFDITDLSSENIRRHKSINLPVQSASSKVRHTYKAIALGVKDYFGKSGFTSACLGLSGGIDSAVVAAIAVDVLGADNVRVLMMPSQFSSGHSVTDAMKLAENLGIKCEKVEIEPIYNSFMKGLEPIFQGLPFSLAEENLQARIRGTLMMAISNKFGNLLLNTSNKSEIAMGYGTLYGDTNGALSILGDVYKTEVYALAEYINHKGEVIPRSIIEKEPSAELREGQKDSDSLPVYDILDGILYRLIEEGMSLMEVAAEGYDMEVVSKVSKLLKASEHKRYQLAPALRVSKCTLGKDRVIPIVSRY